MHLYLLLEGTVEGGQFVSLGLQKLQQTGLSHLGTHVIEDPLIEGVVYAHLLHPDG